MNYSHCWIWTSVNAVSEQLFFAFFFNCLKQLTIWQVSPNYNIIYYYFSTSYNLLWT